VYALYKQPNGRDVLIFSYIM